MSPSLIAILTVLPLGLGGVVLNPPETEQTRLSKVQPDVVVSLTDPPVVGLAALLAARRSRAGFVFLCQDIFPEVAGLVEDFRSDAVNRLLDRINRLVIREADRIVAVGETMRDRLVAEKGADPAKVVVIHNWADCSAIVPGPKRNAFSLAHGLAMADSLVLATARRFDATLVTGDTDFDGLPNTVVVR